MNHLNDHLNEEQLILFYYGEEGDTLTAEQHLEGCGECRELYSSLQRVLNVVDSLPVPERGAEYGQQVWKRVERQIPAGRARVASALWAAPKWAAPRWAEPRWLRPEWRWAAAGAAFAVLMVAAFVAGRSFPQNHKPAVQLAAAGLHSTDLRSNQRVLMVAVGDYLERSQMVLIELVNASPKGDLDISAEQERAVDLVSETRLYRQTAAHTGDAAMAGVLDELERVLLDITHSPSELSPEELEKLRHRLEAEGILFKIRVLGSNVRNQEAPATTPTGQKL
jgi:hypothetical protein